ncbi:uncharacterized protein LOC141902427 isoform X2 [Tubulanus polymorphus]
MESSQGCFQGYLDIKQPPKVRGSKLRVWKRKWIEIHQIRDLSTEKYSAKLDIYTDHESALCKPNEKHTILLELVTEVKKCKSKTRSFAFEVNVETGPVLFLAGASETIRQTCMRSLKAMLWLSSRELEKDVFDVLVIGNKYSEMLSLSGDYRLSITPERVALMSPESEPTDIPAVKWKLNTLKRFFLYQDPGPDKDHVFVIEAGPKCDTGKGEYRFFCLEAEKVLKVISDSIDEAIRLKNNSLPNVTSCTSLSSVTSRERTYSDNSVSDEATDTYSTVGLTPIAEDHRPVRSDTDASVDDATYNTLSCGFNSYFKPRNSPESKVRSEAQKLPQDTDTPTPIIAPRAKRSESQNQEERPTPRPRPRASTSKTNAGHLPNPLRLSLGTETKYEECGIYDVTPSGVRPVSEFRAVPIAAPPPIPARRVRTRSDGYSEVVVTRESPGVKVVANSQKRASSSSGVSVNSDGSRDSIPEDEEPSELADSLLSSANYRTDDDITTNDPEIAGTDKIYSKVVEDIIEEEKCRKISTGSHIYQELFLQGDEIEDNDKIHADDKQELVNTERKPSLKERRRSSVVNIKIPLVNNSDAFKQLDNEEGANDDPAVENVYEDLDKFRKDILKYLGCEEEASVTPPPTPSRPERKSGAQAMQIFNSANNSLSAAESDNLNKAIRLKEVNDIFAKTFDSDPANTTHNEHVDKVKKDILSYLGIDESTLQESPPQLPNRRPSRPQSIFTADRIKQTPKGKGHKIKKKLSKLMKGHKNNRSVENSSSDGEDISTTPNTPVTPATMPTGADNSYDSPKQLLPLTNAKRRSSRTPPLTKQKGSSPNTERRSKISKPFRTKSKHESVISGGSATGSSIDQDDKAKKPSTSDNSVQDEKPKKANADSSIQAETNSVYGYDLPLIPLETFPKSDAVITTTSVVETPAKPSPATIDFLTGDDSCDISTCLPPITSPTVKSLRSESSIFGDLSTSFSFSSPTSEWDPFDSSWAEKKPQQIANAKDNDRAWMAFADNSNPYYIVNSENEKDEQTKKWIFATQMNTSLDTPTDDAPWLTQFSSSSTHNDNMNSLTNDFYFDMNRKRLSSAENVYTLMNEQVDLYQIPIANKQIITQSLDN